MKATKRSRPGRRPKRKHEAGFPLRRPALLAALGLCGWAPAGAADFPPTLDLSSLDGTNGFRLNGIEANDRSGHAVSNAGDVNGDGLADLLIGAYGARNGEFSGASYVVFGRDTARNPFPAGLGLSSLDGTNGFRLNGVAANDGSGRAVSSAGDVNGDGLADLLIGADRANPDPAAPGRAMWCSGGTPPRTPSRRASISRASMARTAFAWTARPVISRAKR